MPETADWEAGIDIVTQSLTRLAQRPSYGSRRMTEVTGTIPANAKTAVFALTGTGIVYYIYLWISSTGTQQNDIISSALDGAEVTLPTVLQLQDNNFTMPAESIAAITLYDEVNFKYAGIGGFGHTFESSFLIYYTETHGRNPTANLKVVYALT